MFTRTDTRGPGNRHTWKQAAEKREADHGHSNAITGHGTQRENHTSDPKARRTRLYQAAQKRPTGISPLHPCATLPSLRLSRCLRCPAPSFVARHNLATFVPRFFHRRNCGLDHSGTFRVQELVAGGTQKDIIARDAADCSDLQGIQTACDVVEK